MSLVVLACLPLLMVTAVMQTKVMSQSAFKVRCSGVC